MAEATRYKITFTASAEKAFDAIKDGRIKTILAARIDKLAEEPEKQGKPLADDLDGRRSVRAVGQRYRIIYQVQQEKIIVFVLLVGIRKEGDKRDVYSVAAELAAQGLLSPPSEEEPA